jgi:hypothetical protein
LWQLLTAKKNKHPKKLLLFLPYVNFLDFSFFSDKKQVIPVMPEAIRNKDCTKKQDCVVNASKRFIANLRAAHPRQKKSCSAVMD